MTRGLQISVPCRFHYHVGSSRKLLEVLAETSSVYRHTDDEVVYYCKWIIRDYVVIIVGEKVQASLFPWWRYAAPSGGATPKLHIFHVPISSTITTPVEQFDPSETNISTHKKSPSQSQRETERNNNEFRPVPRRVARGRTGPLPSSPWQPGGPKQITHLRQQQQQCPLTTSCIIDLVTKCIRRQWLLSKRFRRIRQYGQWPWESRRASESGRVRDKSASPHGLWGHVSISGAAAGRGRIFVALWA